MPGHLASQPPFAYNNSILASLDYALRLATGFTSASTKTINNSFAIDRYYKDGYAQTWNFSLEQNLSRAWVLELSYMGTKGTRLDVERAPNRALPGSPLTAEDRRLIDNAVGFTYETSDGNSIFHAGQARLTRKLSKGVSIQALYTYLQVDRRCLRAGGRRRRSGTELQRPARRARPVHVRSAPVVQSGVHGAIAGGEETCRSPARP